MSEVILYYKARKVRHGWQKWSVVAAHKHPPMGKWGATLVTAWNESLTKKEAEATALALNRLHGKTQIPWDKKRGWHHDP
jgi:hypothetical protein